MRRLLRNFQTRQQFFLTNLIAVNVDFVVLIYHTFWSFFEIVIRFLGPPLTDISLLVVLTSCQQFRRSNKTKGGTLNRLIQPYSQITQLTAYWYSWEMYIYTLSNLVIVAMRPSMILCSNKKLHLSKVLYKY